MRGKHSISLVRAILNPYLGWGRNIFREKLSIQSNFDVLKIYVPVTNLKAMKDLKSDTFRILDVSLHMLFYFTIFELEPFVS